MGIFIGVGICTLFSYLLGYMAADRAAREHLDKKLNSFNDILKINEDEYKDLLKKTRITYETEIREINQRNTRLLNEISHVTGVDEINLPSFGTVYLDSEKHLREAMPGCKVNHQCDATDKKQLEKKLNTFTVMQTR